MTNLRFINQEQSQELVNLYHLARTALAGTNPSKYDRMIQATKWFHDKYPEISTTAAYKDLEAILS